MNFKEAFELMKQDKKVKRGHWAGYWALEMGDIVMHCKDGRIINIRDSEDMQFTITNMLADDWQLADIDNCPLLAGQLIHTFTFGEALRQLKQGKKVASKGWNGKGMFIVYQKGYPQGIPCNEQTATAWGMNTGDLFKCNPYLQIKQVDGSHSMWAPSIGDVLAEDWIIVS